MKKFLSVLMAAVMLVTMFAITTNAAAAPTITATANVSSAKVGDTVKVTVSTSKNSKMSCAQLSLEYNKDYFQVTNKTASDAFSMAEWSDVAGRVSFLGITTTNIADSATTLFTVEFKVLKTGGTIKLVADEVYVEDDVDVTSKVASKTITIACSHANKEDKVTKEATCTSAGTKTTTCRDCGKSIGTSTISATGHKFSAATVTKEATCTTAGEKTGTCTVCGEKTKETIPATGHKAGAWVVKTAATCSATGTSEKKCTVCKAVVETRTDAKKAHTPGAWEVKTAATCSATGTSEKKCTVCKAVVETRTDAKKAHTPSAEWEITVEATPTKAGEKVKKCTVCKAVVEKKAFEYEKLGDIDGNGKITSFDARKTLQAVANNVQLTDAQKVRADVNKDGKISAIDARWILQAAAGTRVL